MKRRTRLPARLLFDLRRFAREQNHAALALVALRADPTMYEPREPDPEIALLESMLWASIGAQAGEVLAEVSQAKREQSAKNLDLCIDGEATLTKGNLSWFASVQRSALKAMAIERRVARAVYEILRTAQAMAPEKGAKPGGASK